MIVIVFGLPGSGKSFFASRLAKKINADYINSDRLRKEMFKVRKYSEQEKTAVYNTMLSMTKTAINQNKNLVMDATFHKDKTRKQFIQGTGEKEDILFIEVQANENITKERLNRERPYSEADLNVYKSIQRNWEPMAKSHLVLESTDENIQDMLGKALSYLNQEHDKRTNQ